MLCYTVDGKMINRRYEAGCKLCDWKSPIMEIDEVTIMQFEHMKTHEVKPAVDESGFPL